MNILEKTDNWNNELITIALVLAKFILLFRNHTPPDSSIAMKISANIKQRMKLVDHSSHSRFPPEPISKFKNRCIAPIRGVLKKLNDTMNELTALQTP